MLKTLRNNSVYFAAALAVAATACNTPGPTTPGSGTEKASMLGTVTKDGSAPGKNASVVLILKEGGADSDAKIVRTDNNGSYTFSGIAKGNYRVAFTLATESERKEKKAIEYTAGDGYTTDYFSFVTTESFDYDGDTTKTFQIPAFNVGWKSNLTAAVAPGKVDFSWAAAAGAKTYNVLVQDDGRNQFFKTKELTETKFSWDGKGDAGKALEKGKKYYYLVNVTFNPVDTKPSLAYGGSALANFTAQ